MSGILDRAEAGLGEWLPQLAGALAILVFGLLLAWAVGAVTTRILAAIGIDRLAARHGVHQALGRLDASPAASLVVGRLVRIVVALVVVVAAVSTLGIQGIEPALNELLLYVPRVVAALVLVAAGVVVGRLLGAWGERLAAQLSIEAPVGRIVCGTVIGVFVLTALAQLGIPTELLMVLAATALVTAGLAAALAFGLGGRDIAGELSAGRYVASSFNLGDRIEVESVEGEIVAFEPAVVVLQGADGRQVRVPNRLLLHSVVTTERATG